MGRTLFLSLNEVFLHLFPINHALQPPAVPLAPLSSVLPSACILCRAWCQGLCAGLLLRASQQGAEQSNCLQRFLACPRMTFAFFPTVSHCRFMLAPRFALTPRSVCAAAQAISPACPSSGHTSFSSQMLPSMSASLSFTLPISDPFISFYQDCFAFQLCL